MHNKYTENLAELIKQKESEGFEVIKPDPYKLLLDIDSPKLDRFFELWWNTDTLGCSLEDFWKSKSGNWHVVLRSRKKLSPKTRVYYQALLGSDQKRELLSLARINRRQKNFSVLFKPPNNPKELINRFLIINSLGLLGGLNSTEKFFCRRLIRASDNNSRFWSDPNRAW